MKETTWNNSDENLVHMQFLQREYNIKHLHFEDEFTFYRAVQNGDIKSIKSIMLPLDNENLGLLSENPVRNLKYHLIITIALITRFCIEGGMAAETAYSLSDVYIRQLDHCQHTSEIRELHKKAVLDFAKRMQRLPAENNLSKPIVDAIDYIYEHLHTKIALEQLSSEIGYSKTYLCSIFKKETGLTLGQYITKERIEAAKNMLLYSSFSSSEISEYLAFSSNSHFIQTFIKYEGVTPIEFRRQNFRSHFSKKDAPV